MFQLDTPPSGHAEPSNRLDRLEHKVRLAQALLGALPEQHSLRRLLHVATVRKDELLLDGVLRQLRVGDDANG